NPKAHPASRVGVDSFPGHSIPCPVARIRRRNMTPATDGPLLANRLNPLGKPVVVAVVESPPPPRVWRGAPAAIVVLTVSGIALRLVPLLSDRCLWIDEAMLALNLVERSPRQLLEPLDWNQ